MARYNIFGRNSGRLGAVADRVSQKFNWLVERLIAGLMVLLVVDVGLGVLSRYALSSPINWAEELARYLMIWAALVAVSSGITSRSHIAFEMIFKRIPPSPRKIVLLFCDAFAFAFFAVTLYFGINLIQKGMGQATMSLGGTMLLPYAAIPVASSIACIQIVLSGIRDFTKEDILVGVKS
jgi:TRAP-type transport system small permease protein